MTLYCNLDYAKQELQAASATGPTLSSDDMRLARRLREVSLRLDSEFPQLPRWTMFAPWYGSRDIPVIPERVNSRRNTFQWNEPLLALTGNITLGSRTLVVGTDVELWPNSTQPPFHQLRLIGCCSSWYDGCNDACDAPLQVTIPGIWGFQRDYANAWLQVTTLAAQVNVNDTTITVNSLNAPDPWGMTPAISVGSLLQIGDGSGEYLEVVKVNFGTNVATVLRGVNGTSALIAQHLINSPVQVWQVESPVQIAVARQANLMYARRAAYTTVEVTGVSEIRYPADWLVEVRAMMAGYANGN